MSAFSSAASSGSSTARFCVSPRSSREVVKFELVGAVVILREEPDELPIAAPHARAGVLAARGRVVRESG